MSAFKYGWTVTTCDCGAIISFKHGSPAPVFCGGCQQSFDAFCRERRDAKAVERLIQSTNPKEPNP